jgi:S-DNA-T family DNA segregation ATPase FtsK/SpoIIIE
MYVWNVIFINGYTHEFFLPNVNNRSILEFIPANVAGTVQDITLTAEVLNNKWSLLENEHILFEGYTTIEKTINGSIAEIPFENNLRIQCRTKLSLESFVILVTNSTDSYVSFKKYHLPKGRINIGRDISNDICHRHQNLVGRLHAFLCVEENGTYLTDESTNGTYLNNHIVEYNTKIKLAFGDMLNIFGIKIIYLNDCIAINKPSEGIIISDKLQPFATPTINESTNNNEDEYFQRSPRTIMHLDTEPIIIDAPPAPQQNRRQPLLLTIGPALTMVIPMTVGVLFMLWGTQQIGSAPSPFLFMGIITSSTAALLGVFWGIINYRHAKKQESRTESKRKNAYIAYVKKMRRFIEEKHEYNRKIYHMMYPSSNECFNYTNPGILRLWERNVNHADFLAIRLGLGTRPSPNGIETGKEGFTLVEDELADEPRNIKINYTKIKNVPICISLLANKLIGVISNNNENCTQIVRIMVTQLAACHSYSDLRMVFLYSPSEAQDYAFVRWLPHVWNEEGTVRMVACSPNTDVVLFTLHNILQKRAEAMESNDKTLPLPHYIVFIADPKIMENEPLAKILHNPPEKMGLSVVLLYKKIGQIPNQCTVIIRNDGEYTGYYSLDSAFESFDNVQFDSISEQALNVFARQLSGFKLREAKLSGDVPDKLTFMEMHNAKTTLDIPIYKNWLTNRTYESMKAEVGYKNADTPLYLDIHEKSHGPHGLVAGTTGSGKSETLQTYILSMATRYHPHEVSFILIDYKGGGMAQSFIGLPHIAGIITNLGGNQTNRALVAIKSEVKRRQQEFSNRGLKHIDEYIEMYRSNAIDNPPIPHLLIIADEFAELKKEQGDFVHQLISVARVGRSLGVHLILATQKPSASVDDEIQSNSRFRLCLRVQDKQDSMDMIRRPDAAMITVPGRGYFQVGNNELFESFQSGWSGAPYDPNATLANNNDDLRIINLWGKRVQGKKFINVDKSVNTTTQLTAMVIHIKDVATKNGISPIKPIWLDPLPERWVLQEQPITKNIEAQIGFVDDPKGQRRFIHSLDIIATGHILVAGPTGSGKTTLLQTFLFSVLTSYKPTDINVYIIDFGSRGLSVFSLLPHVGGIAFDTDQDKIDKLIAMMVKEVSRRKMRFAEKGIGTFKEFWQENNDLPVILLIIDNYAAFMENCVRHEDTLVSLTREAAGYGIYFIFTCIETTGVRRIRQYFKFGIALQMADRFKYEDTLGMRTEFIPENNIPGRGLIHYTENALEFQTALCVDENGAARINVALRKKFEEIKNNWKGVLAEPIPRVPEDLSAEAIMVLPAVLDKINSGRFLPLGYDRIEAKPLYIDLAEIFCYTISGSKKKGKTSLLKTLALIAKKQGADCYIFDGLSNELKIFSSQNEMKHISGKDALFDFMSEIILPEFTRRNANKVRFINGEVTKDEYIASEQKICIFINNIEAFCEAAYNDEKSMKDFMEQMVTRGENHMIYFFSCISSADMKGEWGTKPLLRRFIERREGLHLGGEIDTSQQIFTFDDVPGLERGKNLPAGIGHVNGHGMTHRVAVIR